MYEFYFVQNNEELRLPIPPSKLVTKINSKNKIIDLISVGEFNILKDAGLTDMSFQLLLPATQYPFAVYESGYKPPLYYLDRFKQYKTNKKPIRFKVIRTSPSNELLFDTDILVSLERYTITEDAKEGFDVIVDIELKQYKEAITEIMVVEQKEIEGVKKAVAIAVKQRPGKEPAKSYTVKKGDTLWSICQKQIGDGSKCYEVAKYNNISNPNKIYEGQIIKFP